MGILADAETVYRALAEESPQDARELARSSGIDGERLEHAVIWLELRGRVEISFGTEEDLTRSFSLARLRQPSFQAEASARSAWRGRGTAVRKARRTGDKSDHRGGKQGTARDCW
jgi:hypothetical protein